MGQSQGWVCPICNKLPLSGLFVTDHEHVRGWKDMPNEKRKLYVRGLTCYHCNRHVLHRWINVAKSERVTTYLKAYAARRPT